MEKTIVFGKYENLVGTYCGPSSESPAPLAVLMLTPGMLHHVGPMRLHVQLARRLANYGIPSLRYDLSGIGESLAVGSGGSSLQRATREAIAAMDWMQQECDIEKFVLFGLCSGADDALAIAQYDQRVVGLSMMDGLGYRTKQFYLHWILKKQLPKMLRASKWFALLRGLIQVKQCSSQSMPIGQDIREFPQRAEAERQLRYLLQRGIQLQLIYTGGVVDYYSYENQFTDMFPSLSGHINIHKRYFPRMDHLATLSEDREVMLGELQRWMCNLSDHVVKEPVNEFV